WPFTHMPLTNLHSGRFKAAMIRAGTASGKSAERATPGSLSCVCCEVHRRFIRPSSKVVFPVPDAVARGPYARRTGSDDKFPRRAGRRTQRSLPKKPDGVAVSPE